jgi:hypothetical protein
MSISRLSERLEPFVPVAAGSSATEALRELSASGGNYAVVLTDVTGIAQPQTLVTEPDLQAVAGEEAPLATLLHRFAGIVLLGADPDDLDIQQLKDLGRVLQRGKAPGLLVERDDRLVGVIPRRAIAEALPLQAVASGGVSRMGNASVPTRGYVCRRCVPPPRRPVRFPAYGLDPPNCPRNPLHGPMTPGIE